MRGNNNYYFYKKTDEDETLCPAKSSLCSNPSFDSRESVSSDLSRRGESSADFSITLVNTVR